MSSKDRRIVELEFDNKSFERGVKDTLKTLDGLDRNLDQLDGKSLKGLQDSIGNISFKGMEDGINSLNQKFSAMGDFARRIFENIADDVYELGKKIINSTFGQIMSGGSKRALNIEQAKFMFQGLGLDIEEAMRNANDAVTDTAYGLDEAAIVASQLAASGVQLGDDMTKALTAISGAAAMTGSDYVDLGRIFTTVAGNGRLMGDQLLQFSVRGLNLAADIGEAYGMTEAEVRDLVSKGAISFDMFYETLYNKYAEQAKRANDTFNGALSNVKAALSRIGAEIMTPYYTYARDVLNAVRPVLNSFKAAMYPVFDFIESRMRVASKAIIDFLNIYDGVDDEGKSILKPEAAYALEKIAEILKNSLGVVWNLIRIVVEGLMSVGRAFTSVFGKDILDTLAKFSDNLRLVFARIADNKSLFSTIQNVLTSVFNIIKAGINIIKNAITIVSPILSSILMPLFGFFSQTVLAVLAEVSGKVSDFTNTIANFKQVKIFGSTIEEVFGKIKNAINGFTEESVKGIHWFFDNLNEFPAMMVSLWETVKNFATNTFEGVITFFKDFGEAIKSVKEQVSDSKFITKLNELFDKIKEFFSSITFNDVLYALAGAFIYFKDTLKDVYDFLKPVLEGLFDTINHSVDAIKETLLGSLSGEAGKNLLSGGILATLIILVKQIRDVITSLDFKSFKEGVLGVLEGVQRVLTSYQKSIDANILWTIAKAIALLAGSILVLSLLDTQKVVEVTGIIMVLGAGLTFFINRMNKVDKAAALATGFKNFLASLGDALVRAIGLTSIMASLSIFAFALIEMAGALFILSKIPWENMGQSLGAMGACVAILGIAFVGLKYLSDNMNGAEVGKLAGTTAALAILAAGLSTSMIVFATSLAIFASVYEAHSAGFHAGLAAMIVITAGMVIAINSLQKTFKADMAARLLVFAASFLALSASLTVMAVGLAALAGAFALMDLIRVEGIIKGMGVLGGAVIAISTAARVMKGSYKEVLAMSAAITIISADMYLLAGAAAIMTGIPWDSFIKMAAVIITLSTAVAGVGAIMDRFSDGIMTFGKATALFGVGVLAIGTGMVALATSIALFAAQAPIVGIAAHTLADGFAQFFIALAETGPQLDAALQNIITRLIQNLLDGIKNTTGPMLETLGEIIVGALDNLNKFVPPIIEKVTTLIINVLKQLTTKIPGLVDAAFEFIDALLGAIADHLGEISFVDISLLGGVAVGLGFLIKWLSKIKKDAIAALPTIGVMGLILGGLVAAFAVMATIPTGQTIVIAAGLSTTLATLSVALLIASKIPIAGAVQGALGLAAFFGILVGATTIILSVLGLFDKIKGFRETIEAGKEVLLILGEAIGGFIGNLVGGIIEGVAEGIANSMYSLGDAIVDFASKVKSVDSAALDSAKNLAEILLILGAAEIVNAIARFLGGDTNYEEMRTQIVEFADTLIDFQEKISPLSKDAIEKTKLASEAAKNLAEFASAIPKTGGLLQDLTGSVDFSAFSDAILDFSTAIMDVATNVSGITDTDIENIKKAADGGKAIAELNDSIPVNDYGVWQALSGGKNLSLFGSQMVSYGSFLSEFAGIVGELPDGASENAQKAADMGMGIAELNDSIPVNDYGVWQALSGGKNLSVFGKMMVSYATFLNDFATEVGKIPEGAEAKALMAANMGKPLAELNNSIPTNDKGLWQLLAGGKDIGKFGDSLKTYGNALSKFYKSISSLPDDAVAKAGIAVQVTKKLSELQTAMSSGGEEGLFAQLGDALLGTAGADGFSVMLKTFGNALSTFGTKISGIDFEQIKTARLELSNLVSLMSRIDSAVGDAGKVFKTALEDLASSSLQGFATAFTGSYQIVFQTIRTLFTSLVNSVKQFERPFQAEGQAFGNALAKGISSRSSTVGQSLITIMKGLVIYLAYCEPTFQAEGQRAILAYARGMSSAASSIRAALSGVANAAKGAMNISGSMYWAGRDAVQGFINGGNAMVNSVYWAYWNIGKLALEAAKKALDSNSPSKEFFKLGADSDRGLANGLTDYAHLVESSSTKVANVALNSVGNSIAKLSSMLEDDIDITPTITPVMDLSQVQNGIYGVNGLLSGIDPGYMGAVGGSIKSMNAANNTTYNDSNVIKSINDLTTRIDALGNDMRNLKVVLNNGALVGEIAPDMNNELGNMSILTRRGVM